MPSLRRHDPDQVRRVGDVFSATLSAHRAPLATVDVRLPRPIVVSQPGACTSALLLLLVSASQRHGEGAGNGRCYTFDHTKIYLDRSFWRPARYGVTEQWVNVLEGLQQIRGRLEANGAEDATISIVDQIMRRAALPAAQPASATSLLQLVRMLERTPAANANVRVYNDFVRLEEELTNAAAAYRERQAAEDAKPVPKTKKYYKQLKERDHQKEP